MQSPMSGRQWRVKTYCCLVFEFTKNRYVSLCVMFIYFSSTATVWVPMEYRYLLDYGNEFYCNHIKFQDPFWSTYFVTIYFARSVCVRLSVTVEMEAFLFPKWRESALHRRAAGRAWKALAQP